jgi:DNA-binding protein YbaB
MTINNDGDDPLTTRIAEWSANATRLADQGQDLAARLSAISATAVSANGAIQVTVDSSGVLTDLRLDEKVRQWPATQTAAQIMAVLRRAQSSLASRAASAVAATVGEHSPMGRAVVDGYAHRFPVPAEEARAAESGERARSAKRYG